MQTLHTLTLTTATGVSVPLRFGLWALHRLCRQYDCTVSALVIKLQAELEADALAAMVQLIRAGAEYHALVTSDDSATKLDEGLLLSCMDTPGAMAQLIGALMASVDTLSAPGATNGDSETEKAPAVPPFPTGGPSGSGSKKRASAK